MFLAGAGLLPGVGRVPDWPAFDRRWVDVSIQLGTRVIMKFLIHTCLNIIMQIYLSLDFYAFQSIPEYFFATTYHMFIIHSSYLISGFGAGNISLNILLMPVNYTLCTFSKHPAFYYGNAT